jgi:hypothetical protein
MQAAGANGSEYRSLYLSAVDIVAYFPLSPFNYELELVKSRLEYTLYRFSELF